MKAAILCAGHGKRLKDYKKQKPFLIFKKEALIDRQIRLLKNKKINKIYVILRKKNLALYNYLKKNYKNIKLVRYNSKNPLDSTLYLNKYLKKNEKILVINIDAIYSHIDLNYFFKNHKSKSYDMCLWTSKYDEKYNEDAAYIKIDKKKIVQYGKKIQKQKFVFGQLRVCSKSILSLKNIIIKKKKFSMSNYINYLIDNNYKIKPYFTKKSTFDIDTVREMKNINKYLIFNENF